MSGLELNPRDVLDHLYELGYTNITANQLKEFVKDLKKLIKYDQRMKNGGKNKDCENESSEEEEKGEGRRSRVVAPRPAPRQTVSPMTAELAESNMKRFSPDVNACLDRDEITANRKITSTSCTSSDVVDGRQRSLGSRSETRHDRPKSKQASNCRPCSSKENIPPTRSSSFIRPWKCQSGGQRSGYLSNRSDPVALYHKYQALWQQNKIPGEENHSGLRWNIRERMLGQDPHPRPVSQASSLESMPRRRVTRL